MNDVFVRLSLRYSWCNSFLFFLNMSFWPRCLSRCSCSRCSWALTGPRGSISSDTALSDTDYDRTAEQRLTPPLASHQQRCHITPESRSDKSSATDGQVRRSLRSWCWRATDCSIRFVLSSSLYVLIFFSIDRNCSLLSPFIPSNFVLLYTIRRYYVRKKLFSLCHDLSLILLPFSRIHFCIVLSISIRVDVDDEDHARQSIANYRYYRLRIQSVIEIYGTPRSEREHSTELTGHICCRFASSSVNYSARPASLPLPASMLPRFLTLAYQQPASLLESAEPTSLMYSLCLSTLPHRFPSPFHLLFPLLVSHSLAHSLSPSFFLGNSRFHLPPSYPVLRSILRLSLSIEWMVLVREGGRAGNNRLHPEITEPVLPALERFLNKILFFPPFFPRRVISSRFNFLPNSRHIYSSTETEVFFFLK